MIIQFAFYIEKNSKRHIKQRRVQCNFFGDFILLSWKNFYESPASTFTLKIWPKFVVWATAKRE